MCPPWVWATHWGFFQKVFCNVTTMYPATTSWVLWGFVVKLNHIGVLLWLLWKEPPGDIVVIFQDTFWKKPQWVAQTHCGHITNKIVKEPGVFIQNVPSGYFGGTFQKWPACDHWSHWDQSGGYISKGSSMYPLGNVWTHCLRNLNVTSVYPPGKCPLAPGVSR